MLAHIRAPRLLFVFLQLSIIATAAALQARDESLVPRIASFLKKEEDQDDNEDKDDGAGDEYDDCDRAGVLIDAFVAG